MSLTAFTAGRAGVSNARKHRPGITVTRERTRVETLGGALPNMTVRVAVTVAAYTLGRIGLGFLVAALASFASASSNAASSIFAKPVG